MSSEGVFAVTCIGVVLLVVSLEFLRRLGKEYDSAILKQFQRNAAARIDAVNSDSKTQNGESHDEQGRLNSGCNQGPSFLQFRPTLVQQLIRSVIHMVTFGVAYIVMLLAMYFNGYLIIMIFLGALIGKFVCDWSSQKVVVGGATGIAQGQAEQELTYCCG